jgi:hypothetical protein
LINIDKKSIDTDDTVQGAKKLQQFCETDIDENTFIQECIYFKTFFKNQSIEELFPNVSNRFKNILLHGGY